MGYKILKYKVFIFIITFLAIASQAEAREYAKFGPLTTRNQNPLYLQSIALDPTQAEILPQGTLETSIDSEYSNIFEPGASSTNWMRMDMEMWRIALNSRYAFRDDMEIGVEVPFIQTWEGFLDPFLGWYHGLFGLPNAGREFVPDNNFRFSLQQGNNFIYDVSSQHMELGDITFHVKNAVCAETKKAPEIAWFFDLKVPTGSRSRGLGNGNIDYGFGLAFEKSYNRVHGYLNTAYYVSSRDDVLEPYTNPEFFAYMAGLEITFLPTWTMLFQVNGSTPLLKGTSMDSWDGVPLDLVVGFKGKEEKLIKGKDLIWQFGFSEDVTSKGPSVDFTVFLSIGLQFNLSQNKPYKSDTLAQF